MFVLSDLVIQNGSLHCLEQDCQFEENSNDHTEKMTQLKYKMKHNDSDMFSQLFEEDLVSVLNCIGMKNLDFMNQYFTIAFMEIHDFINQVLMIAYTEIHDFIKHVLMIIFMEIHYI